MSDTGHSHRVAQLSRMLAEAGGLHEDAAMIEACAHLHDLGKIDVPPEILNKPGKLTAAEFEVVKQHARLGAERIRGMMEFLAFAYSTALFHHEHYDGLGGYEGLKGEEIPVYARIVGIADVLDALVSRRPYKEPWNLADALGYMAAESGKHFDPAWIAALLRCEDEVKNLYERSDENEPQHD
ncbi:HD domain-containing protein [Oscillospiraceae bacterium OttesenSCG-928-G22]|nr:HD domain-containing protein [Oscillospiraceae bacterium OttesenSCG-928-G22]